MNFQGFIGKGVGGGGVAEGAVEMGMPVGSGEGQDFLPRFDGCGGLLAELADHGGQRGGVAGFDFAADAVEFAALPLGAALANEQDLAPVVGEEEAADVVLPGS